MKSYILGHSRLKLPIMAYEFGSAGPRVLLLGGVHGDESEGVVAAQALLGVFSQSTLPNLQITLVPMFNIDGVLASRRTNSAGVDLNRNLPTKDWSPEIATERYHPGPYANSEPENQALTGWLTTHAPRLIISLHSWKPLLNTNGDCLRVAEAIARHTGYPIQPSIGYPTPGCLGTYTGLERGIPTLTYEIERQLSPDKIVATHVPAIIEGLKVMATTSPA